MNSLDFDLSEITSNSLNSISDMTSLGSTPVSVQEGGGVIGDLMDAVFGSSASKADRAVLEAARLKNYTVVEFMIDQSAVNLSAKDKDGNTVLHYLVSDPNPNQTLINKVLSMPQAKSFLNKQNKDGDTPLIIAVKNQHHDLCSQLIEAGSDKSIRNREGLRVDTETPESNLMLSSPKPVEEQQGVSALPLQEGWSGSLGSLGSLGNLGIDTLSSPFKRASPTYVASATQEETTKLLNPILDFFNKKKQEPLSSEPAPFNTETAQSLGQDDTEQFLENLKRQIKGPNTTSQMVPGSVNMAAPAAAAAAGGGCGCSGNPADTDVLLSDLQRYFSMGSQNVQNNQNQLGGAKRKKSVKKRRSHARERAEELSRIVNNQADEIINGVVNKIKELLKVDEATARAAKALLWRQVKESHPDLKSSLDVAVEMQKMATDDAIKKLKKTEISKILKDIQKHRAEKDKQRAEKMSDSTSSNEVPSLTNMSETSYD